MKTQLLSALAVVFTATGAQAATRYEIDPVHSHAGFSIRHMMVTNVKGHFKGGLTGVIMLDEKNLSQSSAKATIDVKTLDTGNEQRDGHLKSADFFDAEKHPTITFESTKVSKGKGKGSYKVEGNLTMRGVTKKVVMDVEGLTPPVMNPMTKMNARGATATTTINRKDFGINWAGPVLDSGGVAVGDTVKITLEVEMLEKPAGDEAPPADK